MTLDIRPGSDLFEQLAQRAAEILEERRGDGAPTEREEYLRGAKAIGAYIGASPWRVYHLRSAGEIDAVETDGSTLVALPSKLDAWIAEGGGKCARGTPKQSRHPGPDNRKEVVALGRDR